VRRNLKMIENKFVAWTQYLHWADLNIDRYLDLGECDDSIKIAIAFQWLASEYVAIEGWLNLRLNTHPITEFIRNNDKTVDLLRQARNAVYHYQNKILDKRMLAFVNDYSRIVWVAELHRKFLIYLNEYPNIIYPCEYSKAEFLASFYRLIGWIPKAEKITEIAIDVK